jgi:hypothetical protein
MLKQKTGLDLHKPKCGQALQQLEQQTQALDVDVIVCEIQVRQGRVEGGRCTEFGHTGLADGAAVQRQIEQQRERCAREAGTRLVG